MFKNCYSRDCLQPMFFGGHSQTTADAIRDFPFCDEFPTVWSITGEVDL